MNLSGIYGIAADREARKGYYDIRMKRNAGIGCNVVMELKRADSEGSLESVANSALEQICERDYAYGLKGKTILYGIAFHGKVLYVVSKEIESLGE